jgi:L-lactate dehydrogenase (cytochrome)
MKPCSDHYTISSLRKTCQKVIPNFSFAYLESGTDKENLLVKNSRQFDSISFIPKFGLGQKKVPNLKCNFLDETYSLPFGIAPVGLTGLIRPNAETYLAHGAEQNDIPFCLSTVSTATPEAIGDIRNLKSKNKWFQLYFPKDDDILHSLLHRAESNGFDVLVVTVDIPAPSIREKSKEAGLRMPFKFSKDLILESLKRPYWLMDIFLYGIPRLKTVEHYTNNNDLKFVSKFVGNRLGGTPDWDRLKQLRTKWSKKIIIKGILHPDDARKAKELGFDAIYVSNHGGRQFDGGVPPLTQLRSIRNLLGWDFPIIFDSGVRSGLDILKAIYYGADLVFLGRPFMYGVGAFKQRGVNRVIKILNDQLSNNMMQLGLESLEEIRNISSDQIIVNDID